MELLSTILKSASRVIRVGEFRVLRDPAVLRFASSGSCVIRIGEFRVLLDPAVSSICGFRLLRDAGW